MPMNLVSFVQAVTPPVLLHAVRRLRAQWNPPAENNYGWSGDYDSWTEARALCSGYEKANIAEKGLAAALAVKRGEAFCERDTMLIRNPRYEWPLLACLMHVAARNGGELRVLDFGGAFGSSYFQSRAFLRTLRQVRWGVVEQSHMVAMGQQHLQDEQLGFFYTPAEAWAAVRPQVLLLSGVIPYFEKPYDLLKELLGYPFDFVLVDRTGFTDEDRDRLTVQRVPPDIYEASYPFWYFSMTRFEACFAGAYEPICKFRALDRATIPAEFRGLFYARRKS